MIEIVIDLECRKEWVEDNTSSTSEVFICCQTTAFKSEWINVTSIECLLETYYFK